MVPQARPRARPRRSPPDLLRLVTQSRPRRWRREACYLSPSAPGVAVHLEEVVRELVRRYPVDGLHLDFIRYPGPDYDWSRRGARRLRRPAGAAGRPARRARAAIPQAGATTGAQPLDDLAARLTAVARQARPGLASPRRWCRTRPQALYQNYQAWPSWMARGLLDAVCPMTYTPDTASSAPRSRGPGQAGARPRAVWAGVGAWRLPVEGSVEKIRAAREAGASGVVLFSHESFGPRTSTACARRRFPRTAAAGPAGTGVPAGAMSRRGAAVARPGSCSRGLRQAPAPSATARRPAPTTAEPAPPFPLGAAHAGAAHPRATRPRR